MLISLNFSSNYCTFYFFIYSFHHLSCFQDFIVTTILEQVSNWNFIKLTWGISKPNTNRQNMHLPICRCHNSLKRKIKLKSGKGRTDRKSAHVTQFQVEIPALRVY